MDLLDLFTLLPMTKKRDNNASKDIYWVMSSNTTSKYSTE